MILASNQQKEEAAAFLEHVSATLHKEGWAQGFSQHPQTGARCMTGAIAYVFQEKRFGDTDLLLEEMIMLRTAEALVVDRMHESIKEYPGTALGIVDWNDNVAQSLADVEGLLGDTYMRLVEPPLLEMYGREYAESIPSGTAHREELPVCDIPQCGVPAHYDAVTRRGFWTYMCELHFREYGKSLGLGKGQYLLTPDEAPALSPAEEALDRMPSDVADAALALGLDEDELEELSELF